MFTCIVLFSIIWIHIQDNHAKAENFGGSDLIIRSRQQSESKVLGKYRSYQIVPIRIKNNPVNEKSSEHVLPTVPNQGQSTGAILLGIIHKNKRHDCYNKCKWSKDRNDPKMCRKICESERKLEVPVEWVVFLIIILIVVYFACHLCRTNEKRQRQIPVRRYEDFHYQPNSTSFSNENTQLVDNYRSNTIRDYPIGMDAVNHEIKDVKCNPAPSYATSDPKVSAYGHQTHQEQSDSIPDAVLQKAHHQITISCPPNENQSPAYIDVPITSSSTVSGPVSNEGYGWVTTLSSTYQGTATNL